MTRGWLIGSMGGWHSVALLPFTLPGHQLLQLVAVMLAWTLVLGACRWIGLAMIVGHDRLRWWWTGIHAGRGPDGRIATRQEKRTLNALPAAARPR